MAKECSRAGCMQVAEAAAVGLDCGCLGGGDGNSAGVGCGDRYARWLKQLELHGGHMRAHYMWQAVYASGHPCPKRSLDLRHMSLAAAMRRTKREAGGLVANVQQVLRLARNTPHACQT